MAEWKSRAFDLPDNHGWRARPGNSVFVANRGAVRFSAPTGLFIQPVRAARLINGAWALRSVPPALPLDIRGAFW